MPRKKPEKEKKPNPIKALRFILQALLKLLRAAEIEGRIGTPRERPGDEGRVEKLLREAADLLDKAAACVGNILVKLVLQAFAEALRELARNIH